MKEDPSDPAAAISYADFALEALGLPTQTLRQTAENLKETRARGPNFWISCLMSGRVQTRLGNPSDAILDYMAALKQQDLPHTILLQLRYEMALCYGETRDRIRCRQELSAVYACRSGVCRCESQAGCEMKNGAMAGKPMVSLSSAKQERFIRRRKY